jgi:hypothetical protein
MRDVILSLELGHLSSKEDQVKVFNTEIEKFSKWLETVPSAVQQGALTQPERILLLTYFMQKYAGHLDKE